MIFFKASRTKIGNFLLDSVLKKRNRDLVAVGLNKVLTLGILFDASQISTQKYIKAFLKSLPITGIDYFVIGYVPDYKIEHNYISDKTWYYFTDKDCNFFMQPKKEPILEFCDKPLDLLLVLDTNYHFPIKWISAMSLAKFKAGKSGDYDKQLDFMIEMNEHSVEKLLKELYHYLSRLNN